MTFLSFSLPDPRPFFSFPFLFARDENLSKVEVVSWSRPIFSPPAEVLKFHLLIIIAAVV
jgi:hypothetical protein